MAPRRHPGSLLKELDLDKKEVLALLDLASALKHAKAGSTGRQQLVGSNIALIFEKASTRTMCAFEVAAHDHRSWARNTGPATRFCRLLQMPRRSHRRISWSARSRTSTEPMPP